jgi:ubiquinone/menaquinone biosynthesis C-methylase UbiE
VPDVEAYFKLMEKFYDFREGYKYWDQYWNRVEIEKEINSFKKDFNYRLYLKHLPKKGKILEAGCGLGRLLIPLQRIGYDIEGLDYSREGIGQIKQYEPNIKARVGDVLSLPYSDENFDAYISIGVFSWLLDKFSDGLKEANRVLKKEGLLFMAVPQTPLFSWWKRVLRTLIINPFLKIRATLRGTQLRPTYCHHSRSEVKNKLKEGGFEILVESVTYPEEGFWRNLPFLATRESKILAKKNPRKFANLVREGKAYQLTPLGQKLFNWLVRKNPFLFSVGYFVIAKKK